MNIKRYKHAILGLCCLSAFTACSDMLDTTSEMVEYDNSLSMPEDSLYSVMGIIKKMQVLADRTVLLGELRADLMTPTDRATTAIKDIARYDFNADNVYNNISDYYAVINNCNYFLAHADTLLQRLGKKIFEREYAVVKTYRAWTYLQLAKVYGRVPLVTTPVMTEEEAENAMQQNLVDINGVCDYFINDLRQYVDTDQPLYGMIDERNSLKFFIPVRVLLGEMCLWTGRYPEACQYLSQYLTMKNKPVYTGTRSTYWSVGTSLDFINAGIVTSSTSWLSLNADENISVIPMEKSEFDGVKSRLEDVFESSLNNDYYFQVTPSAGIMSLSAAQDYVYEVLSSGGIPTDTVRAPKVGLYRDYYRGDLRLGGVYSYRTVNRGEMSPYSPNVQYIDKTPSDFVTIYRVQYVYLMFAEALCRAGYPESAFCILKYGLRQQNIQRYIDERERVAIGDLLNFPDDVFTALNTQGIHARGCGDVRCDNLFRLPEPPAQLQAYEDTVQYRIPLVEDMIINEMALEMAFEGYRFYDLMRVAKRRDDMSYLALPVAMRNGTRDEGMYNLLMDENNWYLPKR